MTSIEVGDDRPKQELHQHPRPDIDPESPITTGLMTSFRDNDVNLMEWIGKNYTPAVDHDHDGVSQLLPGKYLQPFPPMNFT